MIFVLGNICRDTTFYVDRMPVAGETINAHRTLSGLGGKGLNQAVAAHRCGSKVKLIAAVGDDWSDVDEEFATGSGAADFEFAVVHKSGPSDCSSILVADSGENLIVTNASQAEVLSIEDVNDELNLRQDDLLLLQCNLTLEITRRAIDQARGAGACIILNPAPYKSWARSLESLVDVIVLNAQEATSWTGEAEPLQAIGKIDTPLVIVTLGGAGCMVKRAGESPQHFKVPEANAIDTTGAGDTFMGVFASEWLETHNQIQAVQLALATASASVERQGAVASIPARHEMDQIRMSIR